MINFIGCTCDVCNEKFTAESDVVVCPECGEELAFMGWSDEELKEKQECPMCKKEIILK